MASDDNMHDPTFVEVGEVLGRGAQIMVYACSLCGSLVGGRVAKQQGPPPYRSHPLDIDPDVAAAWLEAEESAKAQAAIEAIELHKAWHGRG